MSRKTSIKNSKTNNLLTLPINRFFLLSTLVILTITTAIYYKSLNNQLTRWDDDLYVTDNPDITTLSTDKTSTIKKTFSSYVNGNYHPVTMLSFCVEYAVFKINSKVFHTTNLIIHILNSFLVLVFIWLLSKQQLTAFIAALLFAIHPMHVESVAWVSERKDLLYTFFYISALCTYLLYLQTDKRKKLLFVSTFFLFVLSCLSKGMAVSLPLVLFLLDYFSGRKFSKNTVLEKVPFLILSLIIGIIAIKAQATVGAIDDITHYNFFDRFLFSCYGVMMYLWKLVSPFYNSCFYNYPTQQNGHYPLIIYLSPLVIAALTFLVYRSNKSKKEILFVTCFFIITVAMVLQILPVGAAIIAERYTYIPYIGLFFLIGIGYEQLLQNKKEIKTLLIGLLIGVFAVLSFLSYKATLLWKDGLTVLNHAVTTDKFDACALLYKNRAIAYFYNGQYDKAADDYTNSIKRSEKYTDVICDRGVVYYKMQQYDKAINDLTIVIKYDMSKMNAYHYRGLSYFETKKYAEAISDMTEAIKINPIYWEHFYYRGLSNYIIGNYNEALSDYNYLIKNNNVNTDVYNNRGLILLKLNKYNEALVDLTKALEFNPQNANAYFNRGLAYFNLSDYKKAVEEYTLAMQYNPNYAYAYRNRADAYIALKQYSNALNDATTAKKMGVDVSEKLLETLKNSN